jgi:hypothetical protein
MVGYAIMPVFESQHPDFVPTLRRNDGVAIVYLGLCQVRRVLFASLYALLEANVLKSLSRMYKPG